MSILLDALKKSEEQRRLGQTPSIHSPGSEPPGNLNHGQQWIPLSLMAAGAIAMAWIGWQQYRPPAGPEDGASPAQAQVQPQGEAREEGGRENAAEPELPEAAGGPSAERPADAVVARRPGVSRRTPVEGFQPEPESLQSVTIVPPTEAVDSPTRRPDASAATAPDLASTEGDAEPRRSRAETHIAEPISYWELPQGVRDGLPEMRITVLVYAERPEDRFVLIGGKRVVEKDEYDSGVVLDEIRRDGAVFQYRTYRFLVKG